MKPISTNLRKYTDRRMKTDREIYQENRSKKTNEQFKEGDLVVFYKRDFARLQLVGTIITITDQTALVKTNLYINNVNEFYLKVSEVKKYDPNKNSK